MEYNEFKEEVIRDAKAAGLTDYELYYNSEESTEVEAFLHEINEFTSGLEGGVCFRCVSGGKMGYASTERLDSESAAEIVRRAMDNASSLESAEPAFLCSGGMSYEKVERKHVELPSTKELISAVLDTQEKLYRTAPQVSDGSTTRGVSSTRRIAICNSRGLDLKYESDMVAMLAAPLVSDGKERESAYELEIGDLDSIDTDDLTKRAVEKAMDKLGGDAAPTGAWPVVFSPEAMRSLLGTFSAVFSAENTQKGLSRLAGREGTAVAADMVTIVDDPFCEATPMPMPFDAEGCPTRRKNVVENGVLKTLLHNMKTAAKAGLETTGNASKSGYKAPIQVRPFSFYIKAGTMTEEELLREAGDGVFIDSLGGLHAGANAVTGDFSLQSAGFLIEGGKKTRPVKSFTVAGNFYDLLNHITGLSDEVRFPGASGNPAFGSPCVLVQGLTVAGKKKERV